MPLATVQDVEASMMRPLSESESQYVAALLGRAETLLKVRLPDLVERASSDSQFRDLVVMTESEMLARVLRPENSGVYKSEGEGSYSYQLNFEVASGLLDVLPREWDRLLGSAGFRSIAPVTDGYAAARFGGRPDLRFQYGWPANDDFSRVIL